MTKRINLVGGHSEINIAGHRFTADEEGCFTVPDDVAESLVKQYGKEYVTYVPGMEALMEAAEQADAQVSYLRTQLDIAIGVAKKAHETLDLYMSKSKVAASSKKAENQQSNQQRK
jgi:hypothetical protein